MSLRELVVLGTSSQVPTRHRNHNGYLLLWDGEGLLFDPGEGTQRQMIHAEVSASAITRILVTHFHGDHSLGLAGICQRISLDCVPHPIDVHFPASGAIWYERLRHASIYEDAADLRPRPIERDGPIHEDQNLVIEARRLDHVVDTFGYRLEEKPSRTLLPEKLAQVGLRGPQVGELKERGSIEHEGRTLRVEEVSVPRPPQSMAFVMDTRPCQAALDLARGVDLLVCESTYISDRTEEARERGHMTAAQAAELARDAGADVLVLTHFSQSHPDTAPFLEEAGQIHRRVVVARDGMRVPVPPRVRAAR